MLAAILLYVFLKPKTVRSESKEAIVEKEGISPYRNGIYLLLIAIMVLSGMMFVQYFSVIPLYYKEAHFLSEAVIGLILFINGAIIVVFEMPLVGWLERINISKTMATFLGMVFLAASFIVLNISDWTGVLILGMILMTLGEMIGSPFSNALALSMAPKGRKGSYMGMYTMSWSLAHIIGHNGGMQMVDRFGYDVTWNTFFIVVVAVAILSLWLHRLVGNRY
jgi:predicted MFS family arabinose efflux permease